MAGQSAAFTQIQIANIAATLTDISTYAKTTKAPKGAGAINLKTFGSGGSRATRNDVRGAGSSNVTLEVLVTPETFALAAQLSGNNAGFLLRMKTGRNASPGQGDAVFDGTYILVGVKFSIKPKEEMKMSWDLRPAAVTGALIPEWNRI